MYRCMKTSNNEFKFTFINVFSAHTYGEYILHTYLYVSLKAYVVVIFYAFR